jgi:hypothetical protein
VKSGLASGLDAQAEYVLELQYHTQRNCGAGNVAVEGSVIEAFSDMAPSVALAALGRQMLLDELAHVGESSQCRDGRFSAAGARAQSVRTGQREAPYALNTDPK